MPQAMQIGEMAQWTGAGLSLGGGFLGRDFGWRFAATVLTAHAAFGIVLGLVLSCRENCACQSRFHSTELPRRV